jgi:hypothetical protein
MPSLIPPQLSVVKATLLAASLASASDIPRLRLLISHHPTVFTPETVLRVLFFLPETAPPQSYLVLINAILTQQPLGSKDGILKLDTTAVTSLSEKSAKAKLQRLLPQLPPSDTPEELVTAFLTTRADLIDAETGALSIVCELLLLFSALQPVQQFYVGTVQVLYKLVYEFLREPTPDLATFRRLQVEEALEVLIVDPDTVVRDLKELVVPYLSVRDTREWRHVWTRLSALPFTRVMAVVNEWTPAEEVRGEWARWAMKICYHCNVSESEARVWEGMHSVHRRIATLLKLPEGELPEKVADLGDRENPLFAPSRATLGLLDVVITSSTLLGRPVAETVRIRLEGSVDIQNAVLRQFVRAGTDWNVRDDASWTKIRDSACWLRKSGVLIKLAAEDAESLVLSGMLAGTRFALVRDIYVTNNSTSNLPLQDVEKCVLSVFNDFVDNATNGNKTRGRMKYALQTCVPPPPAQPYKLTRITRIRTLYPHTLRTTALERANSLISAVHALSTYHLPSSHNTPLLPVQIRIHPDPLSLISKLLDSNPRSFLKSDALITIGKDLIFGTGGDISSSAVEEKVLGMCTEAALGEEDFETAYAYITSRLLPHTVASDEARSTLWRTSLLAGRFGSSYSALAGTIPLSPAALKLLAQKRELLAWALAYCPPDAAADVLAQWRRNEEEIEVLLEREERAEEEHAKLGLATARRASVSREGEVPQSLLEVARGAARVWGSSGRGGAGEGWGIGGGSGGGGHESHAARERKRDIVGEMVTRGLAGGLGWVLGAQPNIDVTHEGGR